MFVRHALLTRTPALVIWAGLAVAACGGEDDDGGMMGPAPITTVAVAPQATTVIFLGDTEQLNAVAVNSEGAQVSATFTWASDDADVATVDAAGLVTAVGSGTAMITATTDGVSGTAQFTVDIRRRRDGDIVLYKDFDSWGNGEDLVLQGAPFNYVEGTDYLTRPTADMASGIPNTTSLIVLPSVSSSSFESQITAINDPAAQGFLDSWVRGGGWLAAHLADNSDLDYMIPGLTGPADENLACDGLTLVAADHALIRGPDAVLGTADDLTNDNIDLTDSCSDNHGSLEGILPGNATVLIEEEVDGRPVYATYPLGEGRVIVTAITLECGATTLCQSSMVFLPTLANHYYWAINGLDAEAAPAPPAGLVAPRVQSTTSGTPGSGPRR
jgi:hypothetical protein